MDIYSFAVDDFIIHDTRSLHSDTLHLYYSAYVGRDLVATHLLSMGDFDNGEYSTIDYAPSGQSPGVVVVINDPIANVGFIFQLVNAGNPPGGSLSARLAGAAQQLFGFAAGIKGAGATEVLAVADGSASLSGLIGPALMQAFATLWSWLSADCDGPVAVDQISGPRYVLDAWTDNAAKSVRIRGRTYPGADSAHGCGGNSNYELNWSLQHSRTWVPVMDSVKDEFLSEVGLNASAHNGAVHAFGVLEGGIVTHARTFTGATWYIDRLGAFDLNTDKVPVSAVTHDGRLYVFGVKADASISSLAFTSDGTTWMPFATAPPPLTTVEPTALTSFRHRLYMFARDTSLQELHVTSTSDLRMWSPWVNVPPSGMPATSPVAAAALGDRLLIFGVYKSGKSPDVVIMRNITSDGVTWSGWDVVEFGLRPIEGTPADYPLDVAAGIFQGRVHIASRWRSPPPDQEHEGTDYIAVNFSEDGDNWSGWRIPISDLTFLPSGPAGLAAVDNHLYLFAPQLVSNTGQTTRVWAY